MIARDHRLAELSFESTYHFDGTAIGTSDDNRIGGRVVGINGLGIFLGENDCSSEVVADHICYVAESVGPQHVGIGLDYSHEAADLGEVLRSRPDYWPAGQGYHTPGIKVATPCQYLEICQVLRRRAPIDVRGLYLGPCAGGGTFGCLKADGFIVRRAWTGEGKLRGSQVKRQGRGLRCGPKQWPIGIGKGQPNSMAGEKAITCCIEFKV